MFSVLTLPCKDPKNWNLTSNCTYSNVRKLTVKTVTAKFIVLCSILYLFIMQLAVGKKSNKFNCVSELKQH